MNNFKILAISLVVVATAAFAAPKVWTGKLAEGFDGGTGKQDDPYLVSTAEQFALMAARGDSATFYKLTEDIILNEGDASEWAENPPANKWTAYGSLEKPVLIFIDGDSHKVSGLYVNSTDTLQGLFGAFNGTIRNLNLVNGYVKGGDLTGALAGVYYCNIYKTYGYDICGFVHDTVDVYVEGGDMVGGVAGVIGNVSRTDPIFGTMNTEWLYTASRVSRFTNYHDVVFKGTTVGNRIVGGLFGLYTGSENGVYADMLVNHGDVSGKSFVGGVMGMNFVSTSCYSMVWETKNFGSVRGDSAVGGVIGMFRTESLGKEPVSFGLNNGGLFNFGDVTGGVKVGGVVGAMAQGTKYAKLRHSYNAGAVTGTNLVGGVYGTAECLRANSCKDDVLTEPAVACLNFGAVVNAGDTLSKKKSIEEANAMLSPMDYNFVADEKGSGENLGYPLYIPTHKELVLPEGSGTKDDPYLIASEKDLFGFEVLFRQESDFLRLDTLYFKQTADIAWSGKYGKWFVDSLFRVDYNGLNHTILGIKVDRPGEYRVGFARLITSFRIYNLTLKDFEVVGGNNVGMLGGGMFKGYLHNVRLYGTVSGDSIVGGIAGYTGNVSFTNIQDFADVTGKSVVGGVAGNGYTSDLSCSAVHSHVVGDSVVGGLYGLTDTPRFMTLFNVYMAGDVEARVRGDMLVNDSLAKNSEAPKKVYHKKSELGESYWGTALDDEFMKSDAFLDSLPLTFVKDTAANSKGYPVPYLYKGLGSEESPYLIENADDLTVLDMRLSRGNITAANTLDFRDYLATSHLKLTADIDMKKNEKYGWEAITRFDGYLDGDFHAVSNMKVVAEDTIAAFFHTLNGSVKNMGIENSVFQGKGAAAFAYFFEGQMEKCWNGNSKVTAKKLSAGGLIGVIDLDESSSKAVRGVPRIDRVYNTGNVSSTDDAAGGIVGTIYIDSYSQIDTSQYLISNVYNRGDLPSGSGVGNIYGNLRERKVTGNWRFLSSAYGTNSLACISSGSASLRQEIVNSYNVYNEGCIEISYEYRPKGSVLEADSMKTSWFVDTLGAAFEMDKAYVNDGFPILKGLSPKSRDTLTTHVDVAKIRHDMPALRVTATGRDLNVSGLVPGTMVKLYDISGALLQTTRATGNSMLLPVRRAGLFIVRNEGKTRTVKVK